MSTTDELTKVLKSSRISDIDRYLEENREKFVSGRSPFGDFIKEKIKGSGLKQQDVFLSADVPERYGYKLLSGEKHTMDRDRIGALCIGARLGLKDTQKALKLYGMAELYPKVPRDAVLMIAINSGCRDVHEADAVLGEHGMEPLSKTIED